MVISLKHGYLSEYFDAIAAKRLSAVEANPEVSNQHEFNGISKFKEILGDAPVKRSIPTQFIYLSEDGSDNAAVESFVTWYDSRVNHETRTEHRMYYPTTDVSLKFKEGDLLLIAKKKDAGLLVLVVEQGSTAEQQVKWLFSLPEHIEQKFTQKSIEGDIDIKLEYAAKYILDELGIVIKDYDDNMVEVLQKEFGKQFPKTDIFSEFCRKTVQDVDVINDPDEALMIYMDREEKLFKTFERHIVSDQLEEGCKKTGDDKFDDIFALIMSVQQRRKSRAGAALEHHLEFIFKSHGILYTREGVTENKKKPDFIFPSIKAYHDENFDARLLTMLGAKSTCKDRWRQVLSEAGRISAKHLLTLEPAISVNQTDEMKSDSLQLVVPQRLHYTYKESQISWLMNLKEFIELLKDKEKTK